MAAPLGDVRFAPTTGLSAKMANVTDQFVLKHPFSGVILAARREQHLLGIHFSRIVQPH